MDESVFGVREEEVVVRGIGKKKRRSRKRITALILIKFQNFKFLFIIYFLTMNFNAGNADQSPKSATSEEHQNNSVPNPNLQSN